MEGNKTFYIKYLDVQPVGIDTHLLNPNTFEFVQMKFTVQDLITGYLPHLGPSAPFPQSLHLPEGVPRSALASEEYFESIDEEDTSLRFSCPLTALGALGLDSKNPLILKPPPPAFDAAVWKSKHLPVFPFFDPAIEQHLKKCESHELIGRDDAVHKINEGIRSLNFEKYRPIICSAKRGMGKTTLLEAVGLQFVKPELQNARILEALSCGRGFFLTQSLFLHANHLLYFTKRDYASVVTKTKQNCPSQTHFPRW
jgi:hypothetical protein